MINFWDTPTNIDKGLVDRAIFIWTQSKHSTPAHPATVAASILFSSLLSASNCRRNWISSSNTSSLDLRRTLTEGSTILHPLHLIPIASEAKCLGEWCRGAIWCPLRLMGIVKPGAAPPTVERNILDIFVHVRMHIICVCVHICYMCMYRFPCRCCSASVNFMSNSCMT